MPMMIFLEMLFQEGDGRELFVVLTRFVVLLYETLVLGEFLEGFARLLCHVENITVDFVRKEGRLAGCGKLLDLGHDYHLLAGCLFVIDIGIPCKWGMSCSY